MTSTRASGERSLVLLIDRLMLLPLGVCGRAYPGRSPSPIVQGEHHMHQLGILARIAQCDSARSFGYVWIPELLAYTTPTGSCATCTAQNR